MADLMPQYILGLSLLQWQTVLAWDEAQGFGDLEPRVALMRWRAMMSNEPPPAQKYGVLVYEQLLNKAPPVQ